MITSLFSVSSAGVPPRITTLQGDTRGVCDTTRPFPSRRGDGSASSWEQSTGTFFSSERLRNNPAQSVKSASQMAAYTPSNLTIAGKPIKASFFGKDCIERWRNGCSCESLCFGYTVNHPDGSPRNLNAVFSLSTVNSLKAFCSGIPYLSATDPSYTLT